MERPPFNWKVSKWESNKRENPPLVPKALSASQPNEQSAVCAPLFEISARQNCEKAVGVFFFFFFW
jgi:hypothetical protein